MNIIQKIIIGAAVLLATGAAFGNQPSSVGSNSKTPVRSENLITLTEMLSSEGFSEWHNIALDVGMEIYTFGHGEVKCLLTCIPINKDLFQFSLSFPEIPCTEKDAEIINANTKSRLPGRFSAGNGELHYNVDVDCREKVPEVLMRMRSIKVVLLMAKDSIDKTKQGSDTKSR